MAFGTNVGQDFSFPADVSGATWQFCFVTFDAAGLDLATGTAGEGFVGILQDTPPAGDSGAVRTAGTSKVIAGGSFVIGDLLTSDGQGRAIKYTKATVFTGTPYIVSGSPVYAVALEAGSTANTSSCLLQVRGFSG